jgi:hypothetical protein
MKILIVILSLSLCNCAPMTCVTRENQPTGMQCYDVGRYSYPCSHTTMTGGTITGSCYEPVCYHSKSCRRCIEWIKSDTLPDAMVTHLKDYTYLDSIGACRTQ